MRRLKTVLAAVVAVSILVSPALADNTVSTSGGGGRSLSGSSSGVSASYARYRLDSGVLGYKVEVISYTGPSHPNSLKMSDAFVGMKQSYSEWSVYFASIFASGINTPHSNALFPTLSDGWDVNTMWIDTLHENVGYSQNGVTDRVTLSDMNSPEVYSVAASVYDWLIYPSLNSNLSECMDPNIAIPVDISQLFQPYFVASPNLGMSAGQKSRDAEIWNDLNNANNDSTLRNLINATGGYSKVDRAMFYSDLVIQASMDAYTNHKYLAPIDKVNGTSVGTGFTLSSAPAIFVFSPVYCIRDADYYVVGSYEDIRKVMQYEGAEYTDPNGADGSYWVLHHMNSGYDSEWQPSASDTFSSTSLPNTGASSSTLLGYYDANTTNTYLQSDFSKPPVLRVNYFNEVQQDEGILSAGSLSGGATSDTQDGAVASDTVAVSINSSDWNKIQEVLRYATKAESKPGDSSTQIVSDSKFKSNAKGNEFEGCYSGLSSGDKAALAQYGPVSDSKGNTVVNTNLDKFQQGYRHLINALSDKLDSENKYTYVPVPGSSTTAQSLKFDSSTVNYQGYSGFQYANGESYSGSLAKQPTWNKQLTEQIKYLFFGGSEFEEANHINQKVSDSDLPGSDSDTGSIYPVLNSNSKLGSGLFNILTYLTNSVSGTVGADTYDTLYKGYSTSAGTRKYYKAGYNASTNSAVYSDEQPTAMFPADSTKPNGTFTGYVLKPQESAASSTSSSSSTSLSNSSSSSSNPSSSLSLSSSSSQAGSNSLSSSSSSNVSSSSSQASSSNSASSEAPASTSAPAVQNSPYDPTTGLVSYSNSSGTLDGNGGLKISEGLLLRQLAPSTLNVYLTEQTPAAEVISVDTLTDSAKGGIPESLVSSGAKVMETKSYTQSQLPASLDVNSLLTSSDSAMLKSEGRKFIGYYEVGTYQAATLQTKMAVDTIDQQISDIQGYGINGAVSTTSSVNLNDLYNKMNKAVGSFNSSTRQPNTVIIVAVYSRPTDSTAGKATSSDVDEIKPNQMNAILQYSFKPDPDSTNSLHDYYDVLGPSVGTGIMSYWINGTSGVTKVTLGTNYDPTSNSWTGVASQGFYRIAQLMHLKLDATWQNQAVSGVHFDQKMLGNAKYLFDSTLGHGYEQIVSTGLNPYIVQSKKLPDGSYGKFFGFTDYGDLLKSYSGTVTEPFGDFLDKPIAVSFLSSRIGFGNAPNLSAFMQSQNVAYENFMNTNTDPSKEDAFGVPYVIGDTPSGLTDVTKDYSFKVGSGTTKTIGLEADIDAVGSWLAHWTSEVLSNILVNQIAVTSSGQTVDTVQQLGANAATNASKVGGKTNIAGGAVNAYAPINSFSASIKSDAPDLGKADYTINEQSNGVITGLNSDGGEYVEVTTPSNIKLQTAVKMDYWSSTDPSSKGSVWVSGPSRSFASNDAIIVQMKGKTVMDAGWSRDATDLQAYSATGYKTLKAGNTYQYSANNVLDISGYVHLYNLTPYENAVNSLSAAVSSISGQLNNAKAAKADDTVIQSLQSVLNSESNSLANAQAALTNASNYNSKEYGKIMGAISTVIGSVRGSTGGSNLAGVTNIPDGVDSFINTFTQGSRYQFGISDPSKKETNTGLNIATRSIGAPSEVLNTVEKVVTQGDSSYNSVASDIAGDVASIIEGGSPCKLTTASDTDTDSETLSDVMSDNDLDHPFPTITPGLLVAKIEYVMPVTLITGQQVINKYTSDFLTQNNQGTVGESENQAYSTPCLAESFTTMFGHNMFTDGSGKTYFGVGAAVHLSGLSALSSIASGVPDSIDLFGPTYKFMIRGNIYDNVN